MIALNSRRRLGTRLCANVRNRRGELTSALDVRLDDDRRRVRDSR